MNTKFQTTGFPGFYRQLTSVSATPKLPVQKLEKKVVLRSCLTYCLVAIIASLLSSTVEILAQEQSHRILVDDFEKPGRNNALGHEHGAFSDPAGLGRCYVFSYTKKGYVFGDKGYSLYIQWDTSKKGAYAGYWSDLGHLDLTDWHYLSFYVKGLKGGEVLKVGLRGKRGSTYETKVFLHDALKNEVTTEWQRVRIPLRAFNAIRHWDDVNMFSINFEHPFGSDKGAILIDELAFDK